MELVTGIAALSCGKCVLLKEGERLQTKVLCNKILFLHIHVHTVFIQTVPMAIINFSFVGVRLLIEGTLI